MSLSEETLKRLIQEIGGPVLNDAELEQVISLVQLHEAQGARLRELDLSKVLPARLMRIEPT